MGGGNYAVHDAVFDGADQAGLAVEHAGESVQEGGHRGLAIGAGDGDNLEALGGVVVEVGGQVPEGGTGVFDLDVDHLVVRSSSPAVRSQTTAAAPARMAPGMWSCPSTAAPGMATKQPKGLTCRLSATTDSTAMWVDPATSVMRAP